MRCIAFVSILFIGLCHTGLSSVIGPAQLEHGDGHTTQAKRRVLRRVVRSTFAGLSNQFLPLIEATIISNCKANGHTNSTNVLQEAYDEMQTCLKNKTIFNTPKDEYLTNLVACSNDSIQETKNCLADKQKYYPELMLELVKSAVSFMYDNFILMKDLEVCAPNFNKYIVKRKYIQCLSDTAVETQATHTIPTSKASFCKKFIPASYCLTNMIKENCVRTSNLDGFGDDYINAMKRPCSSEETD